MNLNTTAEEWFRIELLIIFQSLASDDQLTIKGTNHQTRRGEDRPDFTVDFDGQSLHLELKVLPKDRNYRNGWQRFLSGKNNRNDFDRLLIGDRDGVIYIYCSDLNDWENCRKNLKNRSQLIVFDKM